MRPAIAAMPGPPRRYNVFIILSGCLLVVELWPHGNSSPPLLWI
jgi:hypothetical protein